MAEVTPPRSSIDTEPYWQGCREGKLLFQRCRHCREPVFHPRPLCPYCLSDALDWEQSSGRGEIYSFTVQHIPLTPGSEPFAPRVLGMIAMAEGFHMFSEITPSAGQEFGIGTPVAAWFDDRGQGVTLPKFRIEP